MIRSLIFLLLFLSYSTAWTTEVINRIDVIRSANGEIDKVVLLKHGKTPSVEEILKGFLQQIKDTQAQIRAGLFDTQLEASDWPEEFKSEAQRSISLLKQHDLKEVLDNVDVKKALKMVFDAANFEGHNFRILAVPNDPKYFDSNERLFKIVRQASSLIKLAMGSTLGLGVALYLVQYTFDMILERRNFYQNYFMHYLDRVEPESLGLTSLEIQKIKSSIFESRISWWDFWQRAAARRAWDDYGHTQHLDDLITANQRREDRSADLTTWGNPLGFAFHDGEKEGRTRVVNLITKQSRVSKKLSLAVQMDNLTKVRNLRLFFFVLQLGVRFAPVPAVSTVFNFFMNSLYVPQRQLEGALYGYYLDTGAIDMARVITNQTINPFVIAEER